MTVVSGERSDFGHTHLKFSWVHHQINQKDGFLSYTPSPIAFVSASSLPKDTIPVPAPPPPSPSQIPSGNRIGPAVLFVIIILAVLFFISGILHLLVRFLTKNNNQSFSANHPNSNSLYPDFSSPEALQRQLQQLFHLHDSGLDQAFIDALPVFLYKEIAGSTKEPFDCAVCLCEFTEKDKLRLLPMCNHAFHINCIDTWLLSNSTCPLCRDTLFSPGYSVENPIFEFDEWRDDDDVCAVGRAAAIFRGENGFGLVQKKIEIEENGTKKSEKKGVFPVILGKFRKMNEGSVVEEEKKEGESSHNDSSSSISSRLDSRRCYSMGSYQYVVADSNFRVKLCPEKNHSSRHVKFSGDAEKSGNPSSDDYSDGRKITSTARRDSYSVSKIWQWQKKGKYGSSSNDGPTQIDSIATSLNIELPWMDKTANV